jgi:hypothetical protein
MSEIKPEQYDLIICEITKSLVDENNYEEILGFYEDILKDPIKYENKLVLMVGGYDEDSRELCEIDEVREYFSVLDKIFPYWFYFLNKDDDKSHSSLAILISILVPIKSIEVVSGGKNVEFVFEELVEFVKNHYDYLNELTNKIGLSDEDSLKITKQVDNCLRSLM